jgi:transposase
MSAVGKLSQEQFRVKVWTLRETGLSFKKIGQKVGKPYQTISKICKRIQETKHFKDRPRSGRPKLLNERKKRILGRILNKSIIKTAINVQKEAHQHHNIVVSRKTVARALNTMGYVSRLKRKKPGLTEKQIKARLEWAKMHSTWTSDEWRHVIWSDEAPFSITNSNGKEYVWQKPNQAISASSVKPTKKFGGGKIMVWSCITWEGVGYSCKIDETMDAELYSQILRDELMRTISFYKLDLSKVYFQADNDPKHTSNLAKSTLEELKVKVMEWPAQSPDLNPMEHYWQFVDSQLKGFTEVVATKDELWKRVESIVNENNQALCKKLIATMPQRVNDVIKAKGRYTRW